MPAQEHEEVSDQRGCTPGLARRRIRARRDGGRTRTLRDPARRRAASDGRVGRRGQQAVPVRSAAVAQAAEVAAVASTRWSMESMSRAPCPSPRRARLRYRDTLAHRYPRPGRDWFPAVRRQLDGGLYEVRLGISREARGRPWRWSRRPGRGRDGSRAWRRRSCRSFVPGGAAARRWWGTTGHASAGVRAVRRCALSSSMDPSTVACRTAGSACRTPSQRNPRSAGFEDKGRVLAPLLK